MSDISNNATTNNTNNKTDASLFSTSTQLHLRWLSVDIMVYDFAPEGKYLTSIYHSHKSMEILIIQTGNGTMYIENEPPIQLVDNSVLFINKNIPHKLISDPSKLLQTYLISFLLEPCTTGEKIPLQWIEDEKQIINKVTSNKYFYSKDNTGCMKELDHILQSTRTRNLGELVKIKNYLSNIIMCAFQSFTCLPVRPDFEDILHSAPTLSASRIIKYINDHFTENITLTSVSEDLFYSPRQFQRIIQDCLGISFSDYLTDLRLTYSKELLRNTNYSMEKVAECSGFKNGKCFSRLFQEHEGLTPYRFRKEHALNNSLSSDKDLT